MKKQICILTKSYKHGGYCVAGIDMETKDSTIKVCEGLFSTSIYEMDAALSSASSGMCRYEMLSPLA